MTASLPDPLERLEVELEKLASSRHRNDPSGHLPGLIRALHVLEEVREEIAAIEAEHVPGRTYSSTEEEDGTVVIRDAETGDVMEIHTPDGQRIYTDAVARRNDPEEEAP